MKASRIITQVAAGLPGVAAILLKDEGSDSYKIQSCNVSSFADIENHYLDEPVGNVFREYTREKMDLSLTGSGGLSLGLETTDGASASRKVAKGNFVLTLADMRTDKEGRKYHDEVEKASSWFIEIASRIEVGLSSGVDIDGGYWKVLYLFEKHKKGYSLVGYETLYYHGLQMTVCQAVCLPPYQRAGHGTEMLLAAYEVCESREILVESPAPAFVALRNRIDYVLVSKLIQDGNPIIPPQYTDRSQLFGVNATLLPDNILTKVGSALHITPSQVAIAFDIWRLGELEEAIRQDMTSSNHAMNVVSMEASYKSSMKRTLLKILRETHEEPLQQTKKSAGRPSKKSKKSASMDSMTTEEQKQHLEMCFNDAILRYRALLT